jgi:hypothetical protein
MLSPDQVQRLLAVVAEDARGGFIEAIGEQAQSRVPIDGVTLTGGGVQVTGTFGEQDGNFDWTARRVLDANGRVIDERTGDFGRKIMGAVWTVEVTVGLESADV